MLLLRRRRASRGSSATALGPQGGWYVHFDAEVPVADFDVLIRNGMIVDGASNPRYRGDVAIRDGIVVRARPRARLGDARELDATGLIVAPGFVDLHTHYDAQVFWDPYCSLSGWHGVTSVAIGNCGFGFAPVRAADREQAMRTHDARRGDPATSRCARACRGTGSRSPGSSTRRAHAEGGEPPAVRARRTRCSSWVLGLERGQGRRAADRRRARARWPGSSTTRWTRAACGWSAQRLQPSVRASCSATTTAAPMPTDVMHDETCRVLAGVLAERNEGVIQMTLVTGDPKARRRALEELAEISGRAGALQRRQSSTTAAPRCTASTLKWLEALPRARPPRVRPGQSPPTPASRSRSRTGTSTTTPARGARPPSARVAERLRQARRSRPPRGAARTDQPAIGHRADPRDRGRGAHAESMPDAEGRTVGELRRARPASTPSTPCSTSRWPTGCARCSTAARRTPTCENLREILANPWVLFGVSDGGAHTKFVTVGPLPDRDAGAGRARARDRRLEEAHWRLSRAARALRRLPRPRRAARGRARRHRRLRLRQPRGAADGGRARLPRWRVAAHPARARLPLRAGERRDHDRRRPRDRDLRRRAPPPRRRRRARVGVT